CEHGGQSLLKKPAIQEEKKPRALALRQNAPPGAPYVAPAQLDIDPRNAPGFLSGQRGRFLPSMQRYQYGRRSQNHLCWNNRESAPIRPPLRQSFSWQSRNKKQVECWLVVRNQAQWIRHAGDRALPER